jgi:hypothetical protein
MKAEGETPYEPHILIRMEAVKHKPNEVVSIIAFAGKDRTGNLAGRSFTNPNFQTLCVPLLGLLGETQAAVKTMEEVGIEDAEALETAEHQAAIASATISLNLMARITLCDTAAALKGLGDEITPAMKKKMVAGDLAAVREKYQNRMSSFAGPHRQAVTGERHYETNVGAAQHGP